MTNYETYESPFCTRYASEEMQFTFSAQKKFSTFRRLWVALARAEMKLGLEQVTQEKVDELEAHIDDIDFAESAEEEKKLRHDVMAHVHTYGKCCPKAEGIIHLGATSCYVGDNTDVIVMRDAMKIVHRKLVNVLSNFASFADKYNAVLRELLSNVESAYKHGLKPQNDVLKVQVKLNESELSIRKAENALRLATMNLCHLIGKPLVSDIRISGNYPAVEKGMDVQVSDISARPEYAILDKQVEIAGQQVRLNRSELLPKVGIMGSYDYVHGFELNDQMLMDKGSFSVLLNVSIPLFHFGERRNKVRAAKAKLMQSRLEQENMNEQMMLELTQAANNLDEARLESELSDRSLLQAEENMKVSKSQYEVGLETLSDYLEAQALWQQAYETQVDAHFQLYLNYVEYLKAAGALSEVKK